jgi:hypothetical protein
VYSTALFAVPLGVALLYFVGLVGPRPVALGTAVLGVPGFAFLALLASYFYALKCDESCNDNLSPAVREVGWSHWIGSWQWRAQWLAALTALGLGLCVLALLLLRRRRAAAITAGTACACVAVWAVIVASS